MSISSCLTLELDFVQKALFFEATGNGWGDYV